LWYFVSVVKFSHPRSGTATDPSRYLHILSQQLEEGQIWLDFGTNILKSGSEPDEVVLIASLGQLMSASRLDMGLADG
jgi:hypothetical protein